MFLQYFHTARYLKPVQVYGRIWHRMYHPKPSLKPPPQRRPVSNQWQQPIKKDGSLVEPKRFRFLNEAHTITAEADWNHHEIAKLWIYNLHYFDDLNASDSEKRAEWHRPLIERWIKENPVGHGNGWEPYPLSLRIVNWIKWSLSGNELPETARHSLALQIRFLYKRIEYHLLGNHLFANGKALVFAGLFFQGPEAEKWFSKGLGIIETELKEQVLDDGGHFERSPMYHAIILEDLLDLINLFIAYRKQMPVSWRRTAGHMILWLEVMCHPDGDIAFFNDTAFGIAAKPQALREYAKRLWVELPIPPQHKEPLHLSQSGYVRLEKDPAILLLDVGPVGPDYIPGHAHADTLSFELSLFGKRVIVNSGISTYQKNAERQRQRGTAAHNTVVINGQDSSEVWGGFRVARRARPFGLEVSGAGDAFRVACAHKGYRRLKGKPVHFREWMLSEEELVVRDRIEGKFREAVARYHFHPDVRVWMKEENHFAGQLPEGQSFSLRVEGGDAQIVDSTWHPEFNISVPNKCLEVRFLRPEIKARIIFGS